MLPRENGAVVAGGRPGRSRNRLVPENNNDNVDNRYIPNRVKIKHGQLYLHSISVQSIFLRPWLGRKIRG